jgi:transposase
MSAANRRSEGDAAARFPRRKKALVPSRYYAGTFNLEGRRLSIPLARGAGPLMLRLTRAVPYEASYVRSVTLVADGSRLCVDVSAEVPVASYTDGEAPDPERTAGVDLGIIHPFALCGPEGALVVSGRALRAESRLHLAESKARRRAVAHRAPTAGQRGSRRWRHYRARTRVLEARTAAASIRPATRRPGPWSITPKNSASGPWSWVIRAVCSGATPGGARTSPPASGGSAD